MKKKIAIVALLTILMISILTGCSCGGQMTVNKPVPEEGAQTYEISGQCTATLNDGVLKVSGSSDIADNTNGTLSVFSSSGEELAMVDVVQVNGQELSYDFEVEDDWPDKVYGFLTFDTMQSKKQPKEVVKLYGKNFANIYGKHVIWDVNGCAAVFQSEMVTVR